MLPYEGIEEFVERIHRKISDKTGLEGDLVGIWYNAFVANACLRDDIVQYDDIKEYVQELLLFLDDDTTKNKEKYTNYINATLPSVLEIFEEKKLIDYQMIETGEMLPRLIGYNYLNDPEFYVPYRKKGDTEWSSRISRNTENKILINYLAKGYEFKENNLVEKILN